jgi:hypothetical protein
LERYLKVEFRKRINNKKSIKNARDGNFQKNNIPQQK